MSYARFGINSSVYIFRDSDMSFVCYACTLYTPDSYGIRADQLFDDVIILIRHLKEHVKIGHRVPMLQIISQLQEDGLLPKTEIVPMVEKEIPHVLLVTLPGHGLQHCVFCDSEAHARSLIEQSFNEGYFEAPVKENRTAFYQTGPGTFYLLLTRDDYERTVAEAKRMQGASPLIVQPGGNRH